MKRRMNHLHWKDKIKNICLIIPGMFCIAIIIWSCIFCNAFLGIHSDSSPYDLYEQKVAITGKEREGNDLYFYR